MFKCQQIYITTYRQNKDVQLYNLPTSPNVESVRDRPLPPFCKSFDLFPTSIMYKSSRICFGVYSTWGKNGVLQFSIEIKKHNGDISIGVLIINHVL